MDNLDRLNEELVRRERYNWSRYEYVVDMIVARKNSPFSQRTDPKKYPTCARVVTRVPSKTDSASRDPPNG